MANLPITSLLRGGGQTQEEIRQAVAEYEAQHGPTTHVVLRVAAGLLKSRPNGGDVAVLRRQMLLRCPPDAPATHVFAETDRPLPAEDLPYLDWCYVAIEMFEDVPTDHRKPIQMVKMQKFGASKLVPVAMTPGKEVARA